MILTRDKTNSNPFDVGYAYDVRKLDEGMDPARLEALCDGMPPLEFDRGVMAAIRDRSVTQGGQ